MQLRTPKSRPSSRPRPNDRVLVINEDSAKRDQAVKALRADGVDDVGAACADASIDGRFDVVVVSSTQTDALVGLIRTVREQQLASAWPAPGPRQRIKPPPTSAIARATPATSSERRSPAADCNIPS